MIAETRTACFESLTLDCGETLAPVEVAYETYGQLNAARSNAICICHALTGDAHAAGISHADGKPGWWDSMIGPGKAFDTDKYFVVCSNVLGGCRGTTGPSSTNTATGKPYAMAFPVITIPDMVRLQKMLIERLGIERLLAVTGGSMFPGKAHCTCRSVREPAISGIAARFPPSAAGVCTAIFLCGSAGFCWRKGPSG